MKNFIHSCVCTSKDALGLGSHVSHSAMTIAQSKTEYTGVMISP